MAKNIEDLDPNMKFKNSTEDGLQWAHYTDERFTVNGLGWYHENEKALIRLPKSAKGVVRDPVWQLAQAPSGARLRFKTDSTKLSLKITQRDCTMTNMCPMGHSGIDVYIGAPDKQETWATTRPDLEALKEENPYVVAIHENQTRDIQEFTLYLPTYNGLIDLEIGIDENAKINPPSPYGSAKPIVFYGTSITQSGSTTRAGNGYVPIISQTLNRDVINLGFSGNGLGEPELADLVASLEAEVFVLDYEANAGLERMQENLEPFCRAIRKEHPETPLVLVSKICFTKTKHDPIEALAGKKRVEEMYHRVTNLINDEYPGKTIFVDGWTLIGQDAKHAYVDGVHPNDAGFAMIAEGLTNTLKDLI